MNEATIIRHWLNNHTEEIVDSLQKAEDLHVLLPLLDAIPRYGARYDLMNYMIERFDTNIPAKVWSELIVTDDIELFQMYIPQFYAEYETDHNSIDIIERMIKEKLGISWAYCDFIAHTHRLLVSSPHAGQIVYKTLTYLPTVMIHIKNSAEIVINELLNIWSAVPIHLKFKYLKMACTSLNLKPHNIPQLFTPDDLMYFVATDKTYWEVDIDVLALYLSNIMNLLSPYWTVEHQVRLLVELSLSDFYDDTVKINILNKTMPYCGDQLKVWKDVQKSNRRYWQDLNWDQIANNVLPPITAVTEDTQLEHLIKRHNAFGLETSIIYGFNTKLLSIVHLNSVFDSGILDPFDQRLWLNCANKSDIYICTSALNYVLSRKDLL